MVKNIFQNEGSNEFGSRSQMAINKNIIFLWLHLQRMEVSGLGLNQSCSFRPMPQHLQHQN